MAIDKILEETFTPEFEAKASERNIVKITEMQTEFIPGHGFTDKKILATYWVIRDGFGNELGVSDTRAGAERMIELDQR